MASDQPEPSPFIENLINSRNRDISLFLPFILGLNGAGPHRETENQGSSPPDRIVFINPFTQGMVVIERSSSSGNSDENSNSSDNTGLAFDSLFNELLSAKSGRPPASKASIDALEAVEVVGGGDDGDQCSICLEEWEPGEKAKQMPCKHRFHANCVEKWLNIHGSCPICRYEMPVDESDREKKSRSGGDRRREIWVSFMFGGERSGERRGEESDQNISQ